jgi:hypothetical protein
VKKKTVRQYLLKFCVVITWLFISLCLPDKALMAQLVISGDFDARGEYLNLGRIVPDSMNNKSFNFSGSASVDLNYNHRKLGAYLSLQADYTAGTNLYAYGQPGSLSGNVYEAWFSYRFSKYFSLQAGRIEISYDDERFFQARDWNHLVTSHNAVIAHWLAPDTNVMADVGFAANRFTGDGAGFNTDPVVNNYRYLGFIYLHKKFLEDKLRFTLNEILDASDNGISREQLYGRSTTGLSGWLAWPDWNLFLMGAYQFGHVIDGRRLSAWYYSACFSYQVTGWLNLMLAGEHMSGDDYADSAEWKRVVHGFSMLYGNSRRNLGLSGFFNTAYRSNVNPGLNNIYLRSTFDIVDNLTLQATCHWFSVPHSYIRLYDPVTNQFILQKIPSSLLNEADLLLTWMPWKTVEINVDYSLLIPGRSVDGINGWNIGKSKPFSYAYVEVEFTPVIFRSHKRVLH